jgi:Condensin complex subunit 2
MAMDDGNLTQADLSYAGDQSMYQFGGINVRLHRSIYSLRVVIAILTAVEDTTYLQDAFDEINDAEMDKVYGDELITNHRLKKIKPIYVNYAKTAKRVDVRRLKDNLWKTLKTEPVRILSAVFLYCQREPFINIIEKK